MKFTKSKIFLFLLISGILGITSASFLPYNPAILGISTLAFLFIIIFWWKNQIVKILAFCSIIFLAGIFRYNLAIPKVDERYLQFYNNQEVKLQGIVCKEPDIRSDKINLTVNSRLLAVDSKQLAVSGRVLVQLGRYPEYNYGDKIEVLGLMRTPPEFEDFSYKDYLARFKIYSVMYKPDVELIAENNGNKFYSLILNAKNKFKKTISRILPEPQASLLSGLILGVKKEIPPDLLDIFSKVGISHIIVISGMHMIIIVSILIKIFYELAISRRISFVIISLVIMLFIMITGFGPASIRAGVLSFLVLFAQMVSRRRDPTIALFFIAFLMLIFNPKLLKDDVGFQLSFLATAGILYISPFIEPKFKKLWLPIKQALSMTLSAQIFVFPWILYKFGGVSLVSPLTNILIIPIVPFAMGFGFVALITGLFFISLGQIVGLFTWLFLSYIIFIAEWFSEVPLVFLEIGDISIFWVLLYYLVLIYFLFLYIRKRRISN